MKTSTKIFTAVLALGLVVSFAGFAMANFDFNNLNEGGAYEKKTYLAEGPVTSLRVDTESAHVTLARAAGDEGFKVEYEENSRRQFETKYENGTFSIASVKQKWYNHIFNFWIVTPRVTLYLDSESYDEITLVTSNGDVSSDLTLTAASLRAESSNGDVKIENMTAAGDAVFDTDNGHISLKNVSSGGSLTARSSNGGVTLENVSAAATLHAETDNGSVKANGLRAAEIFLRTDNRDINGYGLDASKSIEIRGNNSSIRGSVKGRREDFLIRAKTSNGKNNLADTDAGEKKLTVRTDNGSIDVVFYE